MSEPRWPDDLLVRSFAPRRNPLPAPTTEIFDEPRACAKLNFKWFSHVLGALETLTQPDSWLGDDDAVFSAQQQIEQLIEQLSAECDLSLIDVFGASAPSFATWVAQFLADYGALPVIDPWNALGQTLAYGSADDPTYTATCSGVDLTSVLSPGMRIRVSQATGGTKYFLITKIVFSTNTTITLYGGTDYDLNNETITNPCYSVAKAPLGFPLDPDKWSVIVTDITSRSQANPTVNVWYNLGAVSISVPIGIWRLSYEVVMGVGRAANGSIDAFSTLSTANNSQTDAKMSMLVIGTNQTIMYVPVHREKIVALTAKTSHFLNIMTDTASMTALVFRNDLATCVLKAVCAYL